MHGGVNEHTDDLEATEDKIDAADWFGSVPDQANNPERHGETFERFAKDT